MKWYRGIIFILFVSRAFASPLAPVEKNSKLKGVYIVDFKGHPLIERKKEGADSVKTAAMKKGEVIRGQAIIHTDSRSEVIVQLEPHVKIKIYPESELHFPMIQWESGTMEEMFLKFGRIRWQSTAQSQIWLRSDLFESQFPSGVFVVNYNPKAPQVQLMSFDGQMDFQEKNGEQSVSLSAGKKIHFLGQLEEGEIAYDVLLKGKKIPKGQKSQIEDLSSEDVSNYSYDAEQKALEAKAKKALAQKAPSRKNEICKKPNGIFNECAWICENNPKDQTRCRLDLQRVRCVRSRCNANGQWAEPYELDRSGADKICGLKPVVQACDY